MALGTVAAILLACSPTERPSPSPAATVADATKPAATPLANFDPSLVVPGGVGAWGEQHVIVVGSTVGQGAAAVSTDGGATWSAAMTSTPALASVSTTGDATAWALGACSGDPCSVPFFISRDAGRTWSALPATPVAFRTIAFADQDQGWAIPLQNQGPGNLALYRTGDGGQSWSPVASPCPTGWQAAAVTAGSGTKAWVGCTGQPGTIMQPRAIVATRDGGGSWEVVGLNDPSTGARVGRISDSGHLTGIAAFGDRLWSWASRGVLSQSKDAGRTWSDLPLGEPDVVEVGSAVLGSDDAGFALVWDADAPGTLFERTDDGGQSWTVVTTFVR